MTALCRGVFVVAVAGRAEAELGTQVESATRGLYHARKGGAPAVIAYIWSGFQDQDPDPCATNNIRTALA